MLSNCRTTRDILHDRFRAVILGAGYGNSAADSILDEYFDKYMLDVVSFEKMLHEYEAEQIDRRGEV